MHDVFYFGLLLTGLGSVTVFLLWQYASGAFACQCIGCRERRAR